MSPTKRYLKKLFTVLAGISNCSHYLIVTNHCWQIQLSGPQSRHLWCLEGCILLKWKAWSNIFGTGSRQMLPIAAPFSCMAKILAKSPESLWSQSTLSCWRLWTRPLDSSRLFSSTKPKSISVIAKFWSGFLDFYTNFHSRSDRTQILPQCNFK